MSIINSGFQSSEFHSKEPLQQKIYKKRWNTLGIHFSFSKIICKGWLSLSSCSTFSPVIKVGKAEDANVNTHTAASDSDEEFQLHVSVSSKRIKSNLFWLNDKVSKRPVLKTLVANIFVSGHKNYITVAANNVFFLKCVCPGQLFIQTNQVVQPYVVIIDFKYKMYYT